MKNMKICVVCGKKFPCPPSSKKITCCRDCSRIQKKRSHTGKISSPEKREKISEKAKGRDMKKANECSVNARKTDPKFGRFVTNVNAIDWHLRSPEGVEYKFRNLNDWLRNEGAELFGIQPDTREYNSVRSGICGVRSHLLGRKKGRGASTYKGWEVIIEDDKK